MKQLTLNEPFKSKLARLKRQVEELSYLGADLDSFIGAPLVAIVGSRKVTPYGKSVTRQLTEDLSRAGVVIVSGNAIGIDGLAHTACMDAGGRTIAVLPSGVEKVYPSINGHIAKRIIASNGMLISEYSARHWPRKVEFLERNRIIAALSDFVLIPEAAANSGSLNTANHAKSIGVPIGAVPGNINSPISIGTNQLLKEGVHVITSADDVLKILGIGAREKQLELNVVGETATETLILQKISAGFTNGEALQNETKLDTSEFQTAITMLEVQGRIKSDELGNWRIT